MKKYFLIGFYLIIGLAIPSAATVFDKAGAVQASDGVDPINANATITTTEPADLPVEPKPKEPK